MTLQITPEVNWTNMLKQLRNDYELDDPMYILLVENISNSMDSKADVISIHVKSAHKSIIFSDNGSGMNDDDLKKFFNAFDSSDKEIGQIGFVGIGAKLVLDKVECVYVLTRSENDEEIKIAKWWLNNNQPIVIIDSFKISEIIDIKSENITNSEKFKEFKNLFEIIDPTQINLKNLKGTSLVYYNINEEIFNNFLNEDIIKRYIYENFLYNLSPNDLYPHGKNRYLKIKLKIDNGKTIIDDDIKDEIENYFIEQLKDTENKIENQQIEIHSKNLNIVGTIKYIKKLKNIPSKYEDFKKGIRVIVGNKIIENLEFLDIPIKESEKKYVYGYLICNELKNSLPLAKDHIKKRNKDYKEFEKLARQELEKIFKIWGILTEQKENKINDEVIFKIQKIFKKIQPTLIKDLNLLIDASYIKRKAYQDALIDDQGSQTINVINAKISNGKGGRKGSKNLSPDGFIPDKNGDQLESSKIESDSGKKGIKEVGQRRTMGNINIGPGELDSKIKCKYFPDKKAYIYNVIHPEYKFVYMKNDENALEIYILESIVEEICRINTEEENDLIGKYEECKFNVFKIIMDYYKEGEL